MEPTDTAPGNTPLDTGVIDAPGEPAPASADTPAAPLDPEAEAAALEAAEREARVQRLLQRMQKSADFPSLRDSVRSIQAVARSEKAHLNAFTDGVLGDVALASKLLRMINTAFYSSVGGGQITSLARAVALMGFQPVGMLATSLILFERLPNGPAGVRVQQEFSRSLLAATLATRMCPERQNEGGPYLTALFQNLGTMLAWMHFPAEAQEVEALMAQQEAPDHAALQAASRQVLGIGYEDLAIEVARMWGWPENLQLALRRLEPSDPESAVGRNEYLRVGCTVANQLAAALDKADTPEARTQCIETIGARYAVPLGISVEDLTEVVEGATAQWGEMTLVLGIAKLNPAAPKAGSKTVTNVATRIAPKDAQKPATPAAPKAAPAAPPAKPTAAPAPAAPAPRAAAAPNPPEVANALTAALESMSQMAMSDLPLNEVFQSLLTQLQTAMALQRVVLCLRDAGTGELIGHIGAGERVAMLTPRFRVPMNPPADLFGLLCKKEADTLISDTDDPLIAQRLPAWFKQHVKAPCFLLLPLVVGGRPIGLIYGDRAEARSLSVDSRELTLLKALRNQLVMAMRLRGAA